MTRLLPFKPHRLAIAFLATTLTVWLAALVLLTLLSRLPNERSGIVLALFNPLASTADIFSAIIAADASIVRASWFSSAWVVASEQPGLVGRLRQAGAWVAFEPIVFESIAGQMASLSSCMGPGLLNRPDVLRSYSLR